MLVMIHTIFDFVKAVVAPSPDATSEDLMIRSEEIVYQSGRG